MMGVFSPRKVLLIAAASGVAGLAITNDTGAFEVLGRDGHGMPPGKYRVSVIVVGREIRACLAFPVRGDASYERSRTSAYVLHVRGKPPNQSK
jgi:hypothetical protein